MTKLSNYTTELRYIIESTSIEIGLEDYPIFEEEYRELLNKKIIEHYYFNEIGFETPERFIFELNKKMNEIMPYYNQMYLSTFLNIDPLVSYKRTIDKNETQVSTGTRNDEVDVVATTVTDSNKDSTNTANNTVESTIVTDDVQEFTDKNKAVMSKTPTEELMGGDIENNVYASEATITDVDNTTDRDTTVTENTTNNVDESQTESVDETSTNNQQQESTSNVNSNTNINNDEVQTGTNQSLSSLLMEYRESFLNIDMLVIEELHSKFMLIMGDYKGGVQCERGLYHL